MTSKIALPAVVLVTMASVTALVTLDATIVAVALPSIARGLHASFADVEWVIGSYVLCFASLLTPVGALGDHRGRKGAVLAGISIFALASLLCGVAQNAAFLIAARVLQGVGAAFLPPAALGIIGHEFQGPERTRAFGVWGSVIGLAVVAGPVIGGIVTSLMGWRWTFLINLPLCVVLIIAIVRWVPDSRNPEARRYDLGGSVTFCGALFFLTWALIDTHEITPRLAASLLMLIAFIVIERRQRDPMLDLALFRRPDFLGAIAAMAGYSAAAQALVYFFPLYLQNTLHYSALVSGVAMLPYAVPLCLMPRISARASTQYGSRFVLAWGLVIVALGDLLMAITSTTLRYPMFAGSMFISGIGGGLLNGETAQALQATIPTAQGGMAGGFSATVRFAAILLAVAVLGIFYSHAGTPWVMGAASIVAAMAAGLVNLPPLWMKTSGSESRL